MVIRRDAGAEFQTHQTSSMAKSYGLPHLHLSDNNFSENGLAELQKHSDKLRYLDWGETLHVPQHSPQDTKYLKLYAVRGWNDGNDILRIENLPAHHSVVTLVPTVVPVGDYRI